jgi:hypothetical protein
LNVFEREARMRFLAALFLAVAALTSPALAQAVERLENITALRSSGVRSSNLLYERA